MNKGKNSISRQIIHPTWVRTGCHDAQCQKEHGLTLSQAGVSELAAEIAFHHRWENVSWEERRPDAH